MSRSQHVVVASHQRSGTHLTIDAILNNFDRFDGYHDLDRLTARHPKHVDRETFAERIRTAPAVLKTHTHGAHEAYFGDDTNARFVRALMEEHPVIYVYRDGRDVLTSLYYYARENDEAMREVSFSRFLRRPTPLRVDPSVRARKLDRDRSTLVRVRDKLYKLIRRYLTGTRLTYTSFRSGRSGTWADQYGEEDLRYVEATLGDLLERLDYERAVPDDSS